MMFMLIAIAELALLLKVKIVFRESSLVIKIYYLFKFCLVQKGKSYKWNKFIILNLKYFEKLFILIS